MSDIPRCWVAFVVGFSEEDSQVLASFLSFDARNRFEALNCIRQSLPENPKWVAPGGELRRFKVYALHQCAPTEVNGYAQDYMGAFAEMFPPSSMTGVVA